MIPHQAQKHRLCETIKCGVFVNILGEDVSAWSAQLQWACGIPDRSHVEVWLEHLPESKSSRRALTDLLADELVLVHAPFVGLSLCADWPALRMVSMDRLRRSLDLAQEVSAQVVTIHPGPCLSTVDHNLLTARLVEAYVALQAEAGSLTVSVENMPYSHGVTREAVVSTVDFRRLLEMVPHMAFTLDIGHAHQNGDVEYLDFLRTANASIANIHLHDAFAGGRAHLPLGDGEVDLDAVGKTLLDVGFNGYLALETLGSDATERSWARLSLL